MLFRSWRSLWQVLLQGPQNVWDVGVICAVDCSVKEFRGEAVAIPHSQSRTTPAGRPVRTPVGATMEQDESFSESNHHDPPQWPLSAYTSFSDFLLLLFIFLEPLSNIWTCLTDQGRLLVGSLLRWFQIHIFERYSQQMPSRYKWRVNSRDLKTNRFLGQGCSGIIYETTWSGRENLGLLARKDFPVVESDVFENEAACLVELGDHPNIVKSLCWTIDKRSCSLVMEYMRYDLYGVVQKRKGDQRKASSDSASPKHLMKGITSPFEWLTFIDLTLQIATGMMYLHSRGIAHGDLKLNNVLISSEASLMSVKVADFGLNKTKRRSTTLVSYRARCLQIVKWKAPELFKDYLDSLTVDSDNLWNGSHIEADIGKISDASNVDIFSDAGLRTADIFSFALTCSHILGVQNWDPNLSWIELRKFISCGLRPQLPSECPRILASLISSCWAADPICRPTFIDICKQLQVIKMEQMQQTGDSYSYLTYEVDKQGEPCIPPDGKIVSEPSVVESVLISPEPIDDTDEKPSLVVVEPPVDVKVVSNLEFPAGSEAVLHNFKASVRISDDDKLLSSVVEENRDMAPEVISLEPYRGGYVLTEPDIGESGSFSRLSRLGRAARRQFTAHLDEFWGKLFDLHGQPIASKTGELHMPSSGHPPIGWHGRSLHSSQRIPLSFDKISVLSSSDLYSIQSAQSENSLWSREPFEQQFGGVTDDGGSGRTDVHSETMENLRACICKLLCLDGSEWLFRVDTGSDEDLVAALSALEKMNLEADAPARRVCFCSEACLWGKGLLVSFGVWCLHRVLELSLVESRPELWGKYTYVLNRLQGILEPAFSKPRVVSAMCSCVLEAGSDILSTQRGKGGSIKQGLVGSISGDLQSHFSPPQSYPYPWPWGPNSSSSKGRGTSATRFLEMIKEVEQALGSRKLRIGTSAGDVLFPKGKENFAAVLKRYRRRLGNKLPGAEVGGGGGGSSLLLEASRVFLQE